ncbi:MAG TPA: hypothetical protein PKG90_03880 [Chitinophagaceae bacterium]|nr:hypothetical protein [Chitinophagaceae bacterium]HNU14306.1 hypothetical protein [Chitinophagaceae bacterium]
MKQIILPIFCLFCIVNSHAQDASYAGPAKTQVKSFWGKIEMMKQGKSVNSYLIGAANLLKTVKEKDPSYNTSAMEAELKIFQDMVAKQETELQKQNAEKKAAGVKGEEERNYFVDFWQKIIGVYSSGNNIEPGITGQAYYDRVKALNLAEYFERKATNTGAEGKSFIAKIDQVLADYDKYLIRSDRLKWNVIQPMTDSRGASNPQKKMALLEHAKYECEAVLILSPNNESFKKKLQEINKLLGNAEGEASRFFTSDFHKQNLNKIIWSSKPLVIGKESEMSSFIKTEFKTGEYIYGTVYLGVNVNEAMNGNTNLRVRIKVDGGTAIWGGDLSYFELPLNAQNNSYIQFALLPDAQWLKDNYAPYIAEENWTISYFLDELVRGGDVSHAITCELIFPTNKIGNIKSELSLDLNDGITEIKAMSAKLHNELMASRTLPKAGMKNTTMEQQMVAALNNLGWKEHFTKVIINSPDWTIKKNELGVILYRIVSAVGIFKDHNGKCMYQEFTFRQDYAGNGKFDNTIKYNSYGSKREIGCDKVK